MKAVGYISDTEEIIKASCSLFQHDGAAAFKLSERSSLPPALSAKDLPGRPTQIFNVRRILRINCHPVECDEEDALESILDSEDCLNWNSDFNSPNDSKHDCAAGIDSNLDQGNCIEYPECPEQRSVSAAPNFPRLTCPTRKSKRLAEMILVMVYAIETRRNMGAKIE